MDFLHGNKLLVDVAGNTLVDSATGDTFALTQQLVQNIMKSLPPEVRPSFNDQFSKFRKQCPANVRPPATFEFLTQFVEDLEKNYRSNPYLYDLESSPLNIGVNVVRQGTSKPSPQPPRTSVPQHQTPPRPCAMCSIKGFEAKPFKPKSAIEVEATLQLVTRH